MYTCALLVLLMYAHSICIVDSRNIAPKQGAWSLSF